MTTCCEYEKFRSLVNYNSNTYVENKCQFHNVVEEDLIEFDDKYWCPLHLPQFSRENKKISEKHDDWSDESNSVLENILQEYISNCLKNNDLIDLTGVVFPNRLQLRHHIPNEDRELTTMLYLKETTFLKQADFSEVIFKNGIVAEDSDFQFYLFNDCIVSKKLIFQNNTFNGIVDFNSSHFNSNVKIENQIFNFDVKFSSSIFENSVLIKDSEFIGRLIASANTKFSGDVIFENINFSLNVDFKGSTFKKSISCKETKFSKDLVFEDSLFEGKVDFKTTQFEGVTNFNNCKFKENADFSTNSVQQYQFNNVDFSGAQFKEVDFSNRNFVGPANFTNVIFSIAPRFGRADLHPETTFEGAEFNDLKSDYAELRYRILKKIMSSNQSSRENLRFASLELRSHRNYLSGSAQPKRTGIHQIEDYLEILGDYIEWFLVYIYDVTTNSGRSFLLPLYMIFALTIMFACCYFIMGSLHSDYELWPTVKNSIGVSLQQIMSPLSSINKAISSLVSSPHSIPRYGFQSNTQHYLLFNTAQSILNIILYGVFIFALPFRKLGGK